MRRPPKGKFILLLFYINIVIYIGGDIYWRWVDDRPSVWGRSTKYSSVSSYDSLIQKYAQRYGLDWRFVSSMIETESSFKSNAVSSAGAVGLMQIMPVVASNEEATNITDPEENIRLGLKHYKRYFDVLKGETLEDTLKINLAAYNAGIAHVQDAKKLAIYLNLNPREWSSLEKTFPLLEQSDFLPFVQYGFCQGKSVVSYVQTVFKNYHKYRKIHPDYPFEDKQL